jgi:hypothetical protein
MRNLATRVLCPAVLVGLASLASVPGAVAAEDTRYQTTTIRGQLTDPVSGQPMAGATIRFQPVEQGLDAVEATTDDTGAFVAEGLGFANYAIKITTAAGEEILGVNALPIVPGEPVAVEMKISDRIVSTTGVENRPQRFAAVVDKKRTRWSRFWKEFAVFFGAAAATGAAVL